MRWVVVALLLIAPNLAWSAEEPKPSVLNVHLRAAGFEDLRAEMQKQLTVFLEGNR